MRASSGLTPTEYRYTGQLEAAELGLYYYVARWYDPYLTHFIQADTIVPGAGNAKAYDRFAYVKNNPLNYTDPSGHAELIDDETGVIVRTNKKNNEVIVDGGNLYVNDVEKGIANYILTGDENYLYSVRGSSIFSGIVFEETSEKLGFDFGTKFRNAFNIFIAAVMGITGLQRPDFSSNNHVPKSLIDDAIGSPDCVGCGYKNPYDPTPEDILLLPDGSPIGEPGMRPDVKTVKSETRMRWIFAELTANATKLLDSTYRGDGYLLPGGGFVGIGKSNKYGLTIDINIKGIPIKKIHLGIP